MGHSISLITASLCANNLFLIGLILSQNELKKSFGKRSVRKDTLEILTQFCLVFQLIGALFQAKI